MRPPPDEPSPTHNAATGNGLDGLAPDDRCDRWLVALNVVLALVVLAELLLL